MKRSSIIAFLLVVSAIVFAVGVAIERSQGHTEATSTGASPTAAEGSAEREAAEHGATTATTTEAGQSDSEDLLGVNTESIPLVVVAVLVSLALAVAVLLSPKPGVLALIFVIALAAVAFDVREAIHQTDESRQTVMAFAIAAAALHAAAMAIAGVAIVRQLTTLPSRQPG